MVSAYSIGTGKRSEPTSKKIGPGPNAYLPNIIPRKTMPQWTIGGTEKRELRSTSMGPGPGAYKIDTNPEAPRYSIAAKVLDKSITQSPGPGNYNDESFCSIQRRNPSYSIGVKYQTSQKTDMQPGPGAYDQFSMWSGKMSKFSTQPRLTYEVKQKSPGPGSIIYINEDYEVIESYKKVSLKQPPSYSLGTGKRNEIKSTDAPGPGQYQLKTLLDLSKNFTIKPRLKNLSYTTITPGPGAYDQDLSIVKQHQPAYKIGSELRSSKEASKHQPGPGAYYNEHMDVYNSMQKSAPAFRVPKANRKDLNDSIDRTPGPGTYYLKQCEGPKITFKGHRAEKSQSKGPGPAAYNPDDSLMHYSTGGIKIAPPHHSNSMHQSLVPGPGQYPLKGTLDGPKWGFTKDSRSQSINKERVPGPGTYNIPAKFADVPHYLIPK